MAVTSNTGAPVETYSYGPFGEMVEFDGGNPVLPASGASPFRYTGQVWDAETGLHYYKERYYSTALGRFLSPDPIDIDGGLHLYAYAANDPINAVDPSGLAAVPYFPYSSGLNYRTGSGTIPPVPIVPTLPSYSPNRSGWHDYTAGPNLVCTAAQACSRREIVDQMSRYAVPGQNPSRPVQDLHIYPVRDPRNGLYVGRVLTEISNEGLTIKNTTRPGHLLSNGQIERSASQRNSAWYVTTRGTGNNVVPFMNYINEWQGPKIFNYMDEQMRSGISAHRGPGS